MQTIDFQARQLSKSPYYAHFISLSTYQDKRLQQGNTAESDMEKVNMTWDCQLHCEYSACLLDWNSVYTNNRFLLCPFPKDICPDGIPTKTGSQILAEKKHVKLRRCSYLELQLLAGYLMMIERLEMQLI